MYDDEEEDLSGNNLKILTNNDLTEDDTDDGNDDISIGHLIGKDYETDMSYHSNNSQKTKGKIWFLEKNIQAFF